MKKFFIITLVVALSTLAFANPVDKIEDSVSQIEDSLEHLSDKLEEIEENKMLSIEINGSVKQNNNSAYVGIYHEDLTLETVRELNYDKLYGIIVSATVKGSPAFTQKIYAKDIIYSIDGREVLGMKSFRSIIKAYSPGETVEFKIFSQGKHKTMQFTFGKKPEKVLNKKIAGKTKTRIKWNSVAINWIPRFYQIDDIDDINSMTEQMEFQKFDDKGLFMNGFGFRIHATKGFYIGGEWSWYETSKKTSHIIEASGENVIRKMNYQNSFGGITLDKRIFFTKYFQPGIGFLLGAGSQSFDFKQSNGNYDWNHFSGGFDNSANNSMKMSRNYVVFQPRADLYIPILSWVGVRGEVAYVMGYSSDPNWEGSDYEISNSPETRCDGLMFSIGPWIEF